MPVHCIFRNSLLMHSSREIAKADKIWASVQTYPIPEMPFNVDGFPAPILRSWGELECELPTLGVESPSGIMFPYRLAKLSVLVSSRPLISLASLIEAGQTQAAEDKERIRAFSKSAGKGGKRGSGEKTGREGAKALEAAKAAEAPEKMSELRREMNASLEWGVDDASAQGSISAAAANAARSSQGRKEMLRSGVLGKARLLQSKSSKLNYVVSEVRRARTGSAGSCRVRTRS
jgi:hypothetical protein